VRGCRNPLNLAARQTDSSEEVKEIAWKAQHRLHGRYSKFLANGKQKVAPLLECIETPKKHDRAVRLDARRS
jgi:hypothetical protein